MITILEVDNTSAIEAHWLLLIHEIDLKERTQIHMF